MAYGPIIEWEQDYFHGISLPVKTQVVSITANKGAFPIVPAASAGSEYITLDGATSNPDPNSPVMPTPPSGESASSEGDCVDWDSYLERYFTDHFSVGSPTEVLKKISDRRVKNYKKALFSGAIKQLRDPFFARSSCGGQGAVSEQNLDSMMASSGLLSLIGQVDNNSAAEDSIYMIQRPPVPGGIRLFRDIWFQVAAPLSEIESQQLEGKEKALQSDLSFNYNFFMEEYERLLSPKVPEVKIPNLYFTSAQDGTVPYVVYLQNNVKCRFKEFSKLFLQRSYKDYLISARQLPFMQNQNIYATSFPMDAKLSFGTDRNTFVADSLEDSKMEAMMLRRLSEGQVLVTPPEGNTSSRAYTESTLKDTRIPREEGQAPLNFRFAKRLQSTIDTEQSVPSGPYSRNLVTFDLYQWLMSLPDIPPSVVPLPGDHIFLGNTNDSIDVALRGNLYQQKMSLLANYLILSGKLNNISKLHLRSYQEMMRGDTPHSETIAYRISKYSTSDIRSVIDTRSTLDQQNDTTTGATTSRSIGSNLQATETFNSTGHNLRTRSPGSSNLSETPVDVSDVSINLEEMFNIIEQENIQPIQNVWIPNSNTIDIVEYVDTQIKYNKEYTYLVTAYELSVGTEYFYSQFSKKPEPVPCDLVEPGNVDMSGPYTLDEVRPIGGIIQNQNLSDYEKYQRVAQYVKRFDPSFKTQGTGIIIAQRSRRVIIEEPNTTGTVEVCPPGTSPDPNSPAMLNPQVQTTREYEFVFISYCDHYLPPSTVWTVEEVFENVPPPSTPPDKTKACTVFARLRKDLEAQVVPGRSSALFKAKLKKANIQLPSTNKTNFKVGRFGIQSCPDHWEQGKTYSQTTRTMGDKVKFANSSLEAVYLGRETPEIMCECPPPEPCRETFLATTIPSLKVHQIPYMMWSGKAVDTHPVGPDVEIAPYRAVNNELLFLVGAGLGDYYDRPVPITPQDTRSFSALMRAQKSKDGTIKFSSDDPVQQFEVRTLTRRPKRYTDFANASVKTILARVKDRPGQQVDAISFVEKVLPNTKYYYIFRSVDVHGHVSNPTPIYEVEVVDSDGAVYPLVNIYEPDEPMPVDLDKSAERLIQVRPEYLQSIVDTKSSNLTEAFSATAADGDIKLGARDQKLWGKKFKLRLTSSKTKRMVDINLNFKTEHLENPEVLCSPEVTNFQEPKENEGLVIPKTGVLEELGFNRALGEIGRSRRLQNQRGTEAKAGPNLTEQGFERAEGTQPTAQERRLSGSPSRGGGYS
tara:strand:- start:7307 stop:11071 length:3765 start_codon:yes stop_codon:yes gene_type:complete